MYVTFLAASSADHFRSDPSKPWPPPDPDRLFRAERKPLVGDGFTKEWDVDAFKQRQAADMTRYTDADGEFVLRRRPFHERLEKQTRQNADQYYQDENALETDEESDVEEIGRGRSRSDAGEEAWRNQDGKHCYETIRELNARRQLRIS